MKLNNFKFIFRYFGLLLLAGLIFSSTSIKAMPSPPRSIAFLFQPTPIFTLNKEISSKNYLTGDASMFKLTNPVDPNSGIVDTTVYVTLIIGNRTSRDKSIYISDKKPQGKWSRVNNSTQFSGFGGAPTENNFHESDNEFFNNDPEPFIVPAKTVATLKYTLICTDCVDRAVDKLFSAKVDISFTSKVGPWWYGDEACILQPGTEGKINNSQYFDRLYTAGTNLAIADDANYFINDIGYVFKPGPDSIVKAYQAPVDVQLEGDSGYFVGDVGFCGSGVFVVPSTRIVGDIFGGKSIPPNLQIPGKQAGFSGDEVGSETYYKLPGYQIDKNSVIGWDLTNTAANNYMKANLDSMQKVAKDLPSCLRVNTTEYEISESRLNGCSDVPNPKTQFTLNYSANSSSPWYNPNGVWRVPGSYNLKLGTIKFIGKGTILVGQSSTTGGNIIINGSVDEADTSQPVGFIVTKGNISITQGISISPIRGAYFVPKGTFDLGQNNTATLYLSGSFVANIFQLPKPPPEQEQAVVTIEYDSAIADNPPPGFSLLSQIFMIGK